ncbi:hypothetical protein BS50DRAFT_332362 [Corynespora cassiicola Philippines]|uniref:Uncharacterized protein n=1 Tax=Corynespora cassiicola Philippines TaxID=1448308 RepID=A0A2T2NUL7_CORCC|nr:hypothetical protein BS50DRAFT_332362 [Corynespora cassiicola Philippines]
MYLLFDPAEPQCIDNVSLGSRTIAPEPVNWRITTRFGTRHWYLRDGSAGLVLDAGRWTLDAGRWTLDAGQSATRETWRQAFRPNHSRIPHCQSWPRMWECAIRRAACVLASGMEFRVGMSLAKLVGGPAPSV